MIRRGSQKIPKIRKQYLQTIYDGLVNQFDHTKNGQLSQQIDKVLTLQSVYQESFRAQDSIIKFISTLYKEHQSMVEVNFDDFQQEINQLSIETNQERKKQIALSLTNRVQQVKKQIQALTVSLTHSDFLAKKMQQVKENEEKDKEEVEGTMVESQIEQEKQANFIIGIGRNIDKYQQKQKQEVDSQSNEKLYEFLENKLEGMKIKRKEQLDQVQNTLKERISQLVNKYIEKREIASLKQQTRIFKNCLDSLRTDSNSSSNDCQLQHQYNSLALLQKITQKEQDRHSNSSQLEEMHSQQRSSYNKCSRTQQDIQISDEICVNQYDSQKNRSSNAILREGEDLNEKQPQISSFRMCHSEQNEDCTSQIKQQQRLYEDIQRQRVQQRYQITTDRQQQQDKFINSINNLFRKFQSDRKHLGDVENRIKQFLDTTLQIRMKKTKERQEQLQEQEEQKNQKIDELVEKIYEIEEERIRKQKICENIEKLLENKQKQVKSLHINLDKLKEENNELISLYKENRNMLGQYKNKLQDLQDEIKELNSEKDKFVSDKLQLQTALDYVTQAKEQILQEFQDLNDEIAKKNQIIGELNMKIGQIQTESKQKKKQEKKGSCQGNGGSSQLQNLQQKIILLESSIKQKAEYIQKLECDFHIMKKSCEDLKYMNSILKKDITKIKTIQSREWEKLAPMKIFQQNSVPAQPVQYLHPRKQPLKENKNFSFTEKPSNNILTQRNPVGTNHLNKSSLNLQSEKMSPGFSKGLHGSKEQSLNLDFDNFQERNKKVLGKGFNKKYESLTERPITEIVKKKYMF